MKNSKFIPMLSLQVFAESGDGGTAQGPGVSGAAAVPQTKGVKNPLSDVKYGVQEDAPVAEVQTQTTAATDRNAEFEKLIKGEYKDLYDARVQDIVRKRLKGPTEASEKLAAASPLLEMLGQKYGVDHNDIGKLTKAIEEDNGFWEEEAMKQNMSVEQLKEIRKMQRENAQLKQQMDQQKQQESANKLYAAWLQQAEDAKKVYPSFDLRAEMQNQKFVDLLRSNIDAKTAYEVVHKDEIIPAAMQFAAKTVEQKIANKVAANNARPAENGMSSQGAVVIKSDVSQLSRADRQEIIRRVQRGERIRF